MDRTFDRSTTPATLRLAGTLVIESAAELQAALLEALAPRLPVAVEMEGVTAVDITGLQLLAAAERAAEARGLAWVRGGALPESLRQTAEEAGWEPVPFASHAR